MHNQPDLSVVIPTLNEAVALPSTIKQLRATLEGIAYEIIVSDGGSQDETAQLATTLADRYLVSSAGRASQLNAGGRVARGRWLYFLHADTKPPASLQKWLKWMEKNQAVAACFRMRFDHQSIMLGALGYCTRFDIDAFRYGDQSLLLRQETFVNIGGYDESFLLMEGNDIVRRIKKNGRFLILPAYVVTSARKYCRHGALYLQTVYTLIYCLQWAGWPQQKLVKLYRRLLPAKAGKSNQQGVSIAD